MVEDYNTCVLLKGRVVKTYCLNILFAVHQWPALKIIISAFIHALALQLT